MDGDSSNTPVRSHDVDVSVVLDVDAAHALGQSGADDQEGQATDQEQLHHARTRDDE